MLGGAAGWITDASDSSDGAGTDPSGWHSLVVVVEGRCSSEAVPETSHLSKP